MLKCLISSISIETHTDSLRLGDVLIDGLPNFQQSFSDILLSPSPINSSTADLIMKSRPNFNYLYSNHSITYTEPFLDMIEKAPQNVLNILYGPSLDVIILIIMKLYFYFFFQSNLILTKRVDLNRNTNLVNESAWIRSQMCGENTNYLLKGETEADSEALASFLCQYLNDSELEKLFVLISAQLDVTAAKYKVILFKKINNFIIFKTKL